MAETAPKRLIQQLVFGGDTATTDSIEEDFDKEDERRFTKGMPSAYVTVFEGMVNTVIEHEHGLLSPEEINALENFDKLHYNSRYCLVRLVLRKANAWHPITSLSSFEKRLTKDEILGALSELCKPTVSLFNEETPVSIKEEDKVLEVKKELGLEVIDLTLDKDEEDVKPMLTETSPPVYSETSFTQDHASATDMNPLQAIIHSNPGIMNLDYFCQDETTMTLEEILFKLTNPQLQELVKRMKCKPKTSNKSDMIYALRAHASSQSILTFRPLPKNKGKGRDDGMRQTQLPFQRVNNCSKTKSQNQQERLKEMALKLLGKCTRVNFDFFRLVRRLHIIYYREIDYPTTLLLPSLLTKFKKWNYTPYNTTRSTEIWESRYEYLEYEKALEAEHCVLEIIDPPPEKPGRKATKAPSRSRNQFTTPMTPRLAGPSTTPLKTPVRTLRSVSLFSQLDSPTSINAEGLCDGSVAGEEPADDDEFVPEVKKEERVKECLEKYIFPIWQEHLVARAAKELQDYTDRPSGLQRFETGRSFPHFCPSQSHRLLIGYVYTRMLYKAIKALGPLKEYGLELQMLEHLLSQQFWSRGKRGKLYERRAIVLGHLKTRATNASDRTDVLYKLLEGLKEALMDSDTGIVWRPSLMRRLIAVEKTLKIPREDRSQCAAELREANIIEIIAVRHHDVLILDTIGRPINGKENSPEVGIGAYATISKGVSNPKQPETVPLPKKKTGQKSRWQGKNGQIVDVETRALEFYEGQGFRGVHSETQILKTLFGLLFWDILFADIPGAFETAFQKAPLDIVEDSFYYARQSLIDDRLREIRDGKAKEIVRRHDDKYREKRTMCLCVNWDFCTRDDLMEMIEASNFILTFNLETNLQFFPDYRGRSSGGPDLFVWNPATHKCKFVEVKGPGDIARENQKLWFDALLRAGFDVDLCKVIDAMAKPAIPSARKRKVKAPKSTPLRGKAAVVENHSEEEDYDILDPESEEESNLQFNAGEALTPLKRPRTDAGDILKPP
ncbi:hypothetical protein HYPSUDRAFT_200765 [Hypholoma sublateritium FD-334 SS-4]|uniref:Fanconi-associated nuclease n=1 Tax=Hypholoma sublateritium (strain FD-334 SS-4) TaxID=945553 RepID=A0A0D2P6K3_HYPSF|nr:hypothetical protein HYPSUDRAFT_200765 [Hypholoma sublateritium FD-334 SS-4]